MLRYLLIWLADRLAAIAEWLYRRADERRPEGALSLDEVDEWYERQGVGVAGELRLP